MSKKSKSVYKIIHEIYKAWELDKPSKEYEYTEDIKYALKEAFYKGAMIGSMDSSIRRSIQYT